MVVAAVFVLPSEVEGAEGVGFDDPDSGLVWIGVGGHLRPQFGELGTKGGACVLIRDGRVESILVVKEGCWPILSALGLLGGIEGGV